MNGEEAALAVIDALKALDIPFMMDDPFSTSHYGIPDSTNNADLVVELGDRSINEIARHLGPALRVDPRMAFETATGTTRHATHVADSAFTIECFHLSRDPHDRERFRRRCRVVLLGREAWLPSAEDVIITKLRWALIAGRSKDREDARDVIAVQEGRIDWDYVHSWCERHGTRALLDEVRASIPPI